MKTISDEQEPSGSGKNEEPGDEEKENRQPEEPMEQDHDHAGKNDDKALLDEDGPGAEKLVGTTEPAEVETFTLEPPAAFMNAAHDFPASEQLSRPDLNYYKERK